MLNMQYACLLSIRLTFLQGKSGVINLVVTIPRVPLPKKSVPPSFQSSHGWMFEKIVKWSVGEGRGNSVTTRKA